MSLLAVHADAAEGASPGARAAVFIKGLASRIQNECNNQDFAAIRELCVQAAQMADDVALTVEHGQERADELREAQRGRAAISGAATAPPVARSVDTPRDVTRTEHAGPTDMQRAPTPERDGTVAARPATGERGQSAPKGDTPQNPGARSAGTAAPHTAPSGATGKEQTGTPAGDKSDKPQAAGAKTK